jgi:hypothetical protein
MPWATVPELWVPSDSKAQDSAYDLLSSLIHLRDKPTHKDNSELDDVDIIAGEKYIERYITNFKYDEYKKSIFTKDNLLKAFMTEKNPYCRLQIFRVILTILNLRSKIADDSLLKYIDEQFHVENDYIFGLDFMRYDIVPDFVIPKCLEFLRNEGQVK